jgi:hypothetical protein
MRQKLRSRRPSHSTVVAYLALFVALGGTTYAATGGNFILGQSNSASSTTALSAGVTGPAFKVTNTSTGAAASFNAAAGRPALAVNNAAKVTKLNADLLDGKDSTAFLDACPSPLTARLGQICAGSDGGGRDWYAALRYCAESDLRLPSLSEAYAMALNFTVPGVGPTDTFWTNDMWDDHYGSTGTSITEYAHTMAAGGSVGYDYLGGLYKTVCVTDPTNNF